MHWNLLYIFNISHSKWQICVIHPPPQKKKHQILVFKTCFWLVQTDKNMPFLLGHIKWSRNLQGSSNPFVNLRRDVPLLRVEWHMEAENFRWWMVVSPGNMAMFCWYFSNIENLLNMELKLVYWFKCFIELANWTCYMHIFWWDRELYFFVCQKKFFLGSSSCLIMLNYC